MAGADSGFFAVGRTTFIKACGLGLNPACALLVMACGSGKDNVTTKWSAEAVGRYAGVRWTTAKDAIQALCDAGLVTNGGKPARPSYKLGKEGELIWLPRAVVEGVGNEVAPVMKLRQTQDVMALRLFVELSSGQNLREDGGISTKIIYRHYERNKAGQQGAYTVWEFTRSTGYVKWATDITKPHRREQFTKEEREAGSNAGVDFFRRLDWIESLGLIEWVPYLFESQDGEPMHPFAWNGLPVERELYKAATEAAADMLTEGQLEHRTGMLAPVPNHVAEVQLIGVARLRYRPHTNMTAAWWANHQSVCEGFAATYRQLCKRPEQQSKVVGFV